MYGCLSTLGAYERTLLHVHIQTCFTHMNSANEHIHLTSCHGGHCEGVCVFAHSLTFIMHILLLSLMLLCTTAVFFVSSFQAPKIKYQQLLQAVITLSQHSS